MILIENSPYTIRNFSDGALNMLRGRPLLPISSDDTITIEWRFENNEEQVVLYNLVQFIKEIYGFPIKLILRYIPNSYMGKVEHPITEINTLKYFCKFINDLDFKKVIVTDVHSPVAMSLLDRVEERTAKYYIDEILKCRDFDYFFFKDERTMKHYRDLTVRTPFCGIEVKDWKSGQSVNYRFFNPYSIPQAEINNRSILIINDICSYGTEFSSAARKLKEFGFGDICLYATHCENSILNGEPINDPNISHIYTTNSIFTETHEKITVLR